jgi:hypothetical protein
MKDQTKTETKQPILQHLQTHPALNLSYFARELGLDPSNFKKMVSGKLKIKEEVLVKLGELLEPYGYGGLEWIDSIEFNEDNIDGGFVGLGEDGKTYIGSFSFNDDNEEYAWDFVKYAKDGYQFIPITHIILKNQLLKLPKKG